MACSKMCNVCVLTRDAYPCHLETLLLGTSTAAASCCMYDWLSRGGNQAERRQLHFIVRVGLLPTAVYRLRLLLRPSTSTVMCMQCIPAVYGRRRRARRWWSNKCGRIGCIYDRLKVQYKCCMLAIYYLRLSSNEAETWHFIHGADCRLVINHSSLGTWGKEHSVVWKWPHCYVLLLFTSTAGVRGIRLTPSVYVYVGVRGGFPLRGGERRDRGMARGSSDDERERHSRSCAAAAPIK